MKLSEDDRRALLALAREALNAHVRGGPPPEPPRRSALERRAGAFVTLNRFDQLRGCIGYPAGDQPLGAVVARCAVSAASADPRFPPVEERELATIEVEVSVLGPIERVASPEEIEVGRHGVIVQQGLHRGLLLPQVATDWAWDRDTFLSQTCVKAGLSPDAWHQGAEIFRFEAEVFGEGDQALRR